ncbi:hypothetical protein GW765_02765 [Candidatus Parcubacteria bacterium]|uniref:DUF4239 domain-containing protein n=1 Tax=Candidatus Uhrbacteria bacterium CG_4_9_14_3_um_filter_41_35 TaxID=1975034 RepID=A0A2M7XD28_9BACT|nr:hypothetical protein [Candidatus Parcubacteria bacterium]PIQ67204.1 MAG: hypothetical protein COV92_04010 [Candidatus Uhrbacteria bacterium CG11_big_fil_rev_8_21_14_0_20_41_9]PIZ53382.1 MAG: hypothetical protein COY25_03605 [Candidatus Uhrbacteria bacterium CG_4_10_14_0_2_um_filter_41_7]PJA45791.1 MAG: hypothetical protein CO173_04430 [Candidatus Uhrbacteria bacterium CG_4_9_14_3_um_filter_41_35]
MEVISRLFTLIVFVLLTIVYFFFTFGTTDEMQIILTIATFLFATFTGFFMARQGSRYSSLRQEIANFDGHISSIYRSFKHLGAGPTKEAAKVIKKHYRVALEQDAWDYHFKNKSTTLTDLHRILDKIKDGNSDVEKLSMEYIISSLQQLQLSRKAMVNLSLERIPMYQWVLIMLLAGILLLTVSAVPTIYAFVPSLLKGAFGTSIVVVLMILWELDTLSFFESEFGERSAEDVLAIIAGKK